MVCYRFRSTTTKQQVFWLVNLLCNKFSDWSVTGTNQRQQINKPSDWSVCYITSVSVGLFYRCRSVTTKQQALWLVYLFYNKYSDWSVTGSDQRRQSNKSSDWSICYVTSVLIGLLQVPINDDKATSLLIGLSLETRKEHIVRAVLESLAFRFTLLYETLLNETKTRMSFLIRCGLVISYNIIIIVFSPIISLNSPFQFTRHWMACIRSAVDIGHSGWTTAS